MTAFVIVLLVILGIGLIPVGVFAKYDEDLSVFLTVLGIRFQVYPSRKEEKEKPEEAPKKEKKKFQFPKRDSLEEYLHLFLEILGKLRRKILIRKLKLHAIFGGSDAADSALNYGRAWAAIGVVMPLLENCFRIKQRDVGAYQGEDEKSVRIIAEAAATLRVSQILHIALLALVRFMKIYKKNNSNDSKEGGAVT